MVLFPSKTTGGARRDAISISQIAMINREALAV